MNKTNLICLLILLILSGEIILAGEKTSEIFLPIELTEEERGRLDEIGLDREQTELPPQPSRSIAEYEPMSGVLIRYPLGIPISLVVLMSEEIEVVTIVADQNIQNTAIDTYVNNGVNMANCSFLIAGTDNIHTRDFGPWFIFDGNNEIGIVDFEYDRPRPLSNAIPAIFAEDNEINYYHMGLVHTGGDYMSDGMGVAASTTAVYAVNSDLTPAQVNERMEEYLGIETYHVVPNIHGGLSHIDTWGKFLAPDKIMIREVPPSHPYYNHAEQAVAYFQSQISSYGRPYRVYRVFTPNNEPYTNTLILNNRVFVPFTGSEWDNAALQSFEQAMPGYTVYGLHYNYWGSNDALHCRAKEIADRGMLYIYHLPIIEDQQSYHDYEIQARIIPMSGEDLYPDSLRVYYRVDDGAFLSVLMTSDTTIPNIEHWYTASIPQQEIGSQISYYISAADESGRSENHPYIGQHDPHVFNIISPLVFIDAGIDDSAHGNDNGLFEPGETVQIIAVYRNDGPLTINSITARLETESQFIAIHYPGQASINNIGSQESFELLFTVSSSLATPSNYFALFNIEIEGDEGLNSADSFEIQIHTHVVEEYFVQESFDTWLPANWEVTSTSGQVNWQQSNTNLAGGAVPEARFYYTPSTIAVQRLISPSIDTSGYSLICLEFKHLINDYYGGYTLQLETSGDGGITWTELISFPALNMPATTEEIMIDNEDVGSDQFRIAWTFDGDSWDINWWNIDDVSIGGIVLHELAYFVGQVSLTDNMGNVANVLISAGDQITYADEDGFYSLAVLEGYYDVTAALHGYVPQTAEDIFIAAGESIVIDFDLEYLAPPVNLTYDLEFPEVTLIWELFEPVGQDTFLQDSNDMRSSLATKRMVYRPLSHFNVYRSFGNEEFEMAGTSVTTVFVDMVIEGCQYQYYVTAVYDQEYESEASNIVIVDTDLFAEEPVLPVTYLKANYPNPFNPVTNIEFSLAETDFVIIEIFNIRGQKVRTLVQKEYEAGSHLVVWDGKGNRGNEVAGGIYFYRFRCGDYVKTRKMLLLK